MMKLQVPLTHRVNTSKLRVLPGRAYPLGAMMRNNGVRFALVSRNADKVWLALFNRIEDKEPAVEVPFDSLKHRVGDVWSIFVEGISSGALYMYRVAGPNDPARGMRFDDEKYLLDPYARVVVGDFERGTAKCLVVDEKPDWVDDIRPRLHFNDLVIYEAHVRGFTCHDTAHVQYPGTYLGLIEKIPYLKALGVTAVELLPIQEAGPASLGRCSVATRTELTNYWGYNPICMFAPTGRYATRAGHGEQLREFRQMVSALHHAGMEIILDVVFNHTAEGNQCGPSLCFRGIDNVIYYMLDEDGGYRNFSGCGNTLNCNHPLVRDFILDCLRYWVAVMHVDGFRFDLASILGRDTKGRVVENAGLIERIAEDPVLRDTKLIAEAWDAGGAYQVGSFGDIRWAEWNGRYRDDVRKFWCGDPFSRNIFATRITGSDDLYGAGRTPSHSINFITCHDGFTLRDLFSYDTKHNEQNGEDNTDGANDNCSWNCGVEGDTDDPAINALRMRLQKSSIATLFLSLGTPMLLGGDEFGRTQQGNNNAYCQDNEISWHDWRLLESNNELFRFTKEIIRFRHDNRVFSRTAYFKGRPAAAGAQPDLAWFDPFGEPMNWESASPYLACRIDGSVNRGTSLYLMFNPTLAPADFYIPEGRWAIRVNTGAPAPDDIHGWDTARTIQGPTSITLEPKSLTVLTMRA